MKEGISQFIKQGMLVEDGLAKAIANYMFREIIEDAHCKYGISQEDMKQMNKKAVDRADLLVDILKNDTMRMAFMTYALEGAEWDPVDQEGELAEDTDKIRQWLVKEAQGIDEYLEKNGLTKSGRKKKNKNCT